MSDRDGTTCSHCKIISMIFLVPIAIVCGIIVLALFVALILLFLPIFIVFILPCVIVAKCMQEKPENGPIKIIKDDSEDGIEEGVPLKTVVTNHNEVMNGDVIHHGDMNHELNIEINETVIENQPVAQKLIEQI